MERQRPIARPDRSLLLHNDGSWLGAHTWAKSTARCATANGNARENSTGLAPVVHVLGTNCTGVGQSATRYCTELGALPTPRAATARHLIGLGPQHHPSPARPPMTPGTARELGSPPRATARNLGLSGAARGNCTPHAPSLARTP